MKKRNSNPTQLWNNYRENWFLKSVLTTSLSILLAFLVDRKYDDYKNKKNLHKALELAFQEVQKNIAEIDSILPLQLEYRDSLFKYINVPQHTLMDVTSAPPYLNYPTLESSALTFAQSQEALNDDFDLASRISSIKKHSDYYTKGNALLDEVLYSIQTNSTGDDGILIKKLMYNLLGNNAGEAINLKKRYEEFCSWLQTKGYI